VLLPLEAALKPTLTRIDGEAAAYFQGFVGFEPRTACVEVEAVGADRQRRARL
jgi:hypothetical protein